MSLPDATAAAALDGDIRPVFFAFLDFVDDPIRANSSGFELTPTGTGDPDLDDHPFLGVSHKFVSVSPVSVREGGSESVTAEISGLPGIDDDTLAQIDDPANWQGRPARLWRMIRDSANVQQGALQAYYTGYMVALDQVGSPESQTIRVTIETYLAAFSRASNRSYLDQERYDSGDLSARAAIGIANGGTGNPNATVATGGRSGGGGGLASGGIYQNEVMR